MTHVCSMHRARCMHVTCSDHCTQLFVGLNDKSVTPVAQATFMVHPPYMDRQQPAPSLSIPT